MSRLNQMNDAVSMVAELERRYKELKASQIVGSDAVRTFKTASNNTWDYSQYLAPNQVQEIIVTFTPAASGTKRTAGAYALRLLANQSEVHVQRMRVTDFSEQKWRVTMIGYGSTAQIKFWIFATGKGTISFTPL